MKKLFSLIVTVCLIYLLTIPAYGAGSVNISISPSASSVSRGDTITFTVYVSASDSCTQFGLQLDYDSSVFEMVGGSHSVSGAQFAEFHPSRGFAVLYGSATVPSGTVGTFTLRAKQDASLGSTYVGGNASAMNGSSSVSSSASGASVSIVCDHSFGGWTKVDDTNHQRTCSSCSHVETLNHTWDGGKVTTPATCKTEGESLYTCTGCGATRTQKLPLAGHSFSSWTKVDNNQHKHTCSVCQLSETNNHTWNSGTVIKEATCISAGEIRYTCTGCGMIRTETVAKLSTHTYDHGCDNTCNICNASRTTSHSYSSSWSSDKTGHWHACVHCGDKKDITSHTAGPEPTDTTAQTCTICNYIIKPSLRHEHSYSTELTGDETGHWFACSQCDTQKDFAAHTFDNNCDEQCNVCPFTRTITHDVSETWTSDRNKHWHACKSCEEIFDSQPHNWRRGVCKVCRAEDPSYEPVVLPPIVYILIGAVAGSAITVAAFVLVLKKKRRPTDEKKEAVDA